MTTEQKPSVRVRIKHRSDRPHASWCDPVGWEPVNPSDEPSWFIEDGCLWSKQRREAGLAVFITDRQPLEEDELEVLLEDLRWLESGTCNVLCEVAIKK